MGNSMGNSKSIESSYITLTLIQKNINEKISGFVDNKLEINVVEGTLVKTALEDFNKFRRPNNKIYCVDIADYEKIINKNIFVYIIL